MRKSANLHSYLLSIPNSNYSYESEKSMTHFAWQYFSYYLPSPHAFQKVLQVKINLNVYFDTSLWCLKRPYGRLKGMHQKEV